MKGIEYATVAWNPVTGCTYGCSYCWARRMAQRLRGRFGYPKDDPFRPTLHLDRLQKRWRKPQIVATCFMGDLFDPEVPHGWREQVFQKMADELNHTFLLLTKQPEVLATFAYRIASWTVWPENVWAGVSVTGDGDRPRIKSLCEARVAHRWISYEPALSPLLILDPRLSAIEWVIAGCMTGPGTTPAHPDWFRSARDDCAAAGIPFFLKRVDATTHLLDGREHRELPTEFAL